MAAQQQHLEAILMSLGRIEATVNGTFHMVHQAQMAPKPDQSPAPPPPPPPPAPQPEKEPGEAKRDPAPYWWPSDLAWKIIAVLAALLLLPESKQQLIISSILPAVK